MSATAAEVYQLPGIVVIDGSDAAEEVVVIRDAEQVLVVSASETREGVQRDVFNAAGVSVILFVGWNGNDLFWNQTGIPAVALGGSGNDMLIGGSGLDEFYGESGNDALLGGDGNDRLSGDEGSDTANGGSGNDTLYGGADQDWLVGMAGNDTVYGGTGDDLMLGDTGDDELHGEDGNDAISGAAGADRMWGDAGHDLLVGGGGRDVIEGGLGDDVVSAGADNDTVRAGDGEDIVLGGFGNDSLYGDVGADLLLGADGHDTVRGGDGSDVILGASGTDWLYGDSGNDQIFGGTGTDWVDGGAGYDVLDGGTDYDFLIGGADVDFYFDTGSNYASSAYSWGSSTTPALSGDIEESQAAGNLLPATLLDAVFAEREALFSQLDQPTLPTGYQTLPLNDEPLSAHYATATQIADSFGGTFAATSSPSSSTPIGTGDIFGGNAFYSNAVAEGLVWAGPQNGAFVGQFFNNPGIAALHGGALTGVQANQVLAPYLGMPQQQFLAGFTSNIPILSGLSSAIPGLVLPF